MRHHLLTLAVSASYLFPPPAAATGPEPPPFAEEGVTYQSDELKLAAALLLPPSPERRLPGAVILQGSGDSDRTNAWARAIAEGLAQRGVVVLLTDKRGSGLSAGDWRRADFEDLAEDAIAGAAYLRSRPEVDPARVGYVGLSQGGHVAPYAGSLDGATAFVVAISASATPLAEQMSHEMRNTFRQAGLPPEGVAAGMKIQELAELYVRTGEWEPYAEALAKAAESELAPVAAGFPQSRDSWVWGWVRRVAEYDPLPRWRQVQAPILVVYGEDDENDNVPVQESVRRLEQTLAGRRSPYRIEVFPGSGHALYQPGHQPRRVRREVFDLVAAIARGELGGEEAQRPDVPAERR